MKPLRRLFLRLGACAAALTAVSQTAPAQNYPSRPVTMVVPFAPGGPTDTIARIIAEHMRGSLGQPVIIRERERRRRKHRRRPRRPSYARWLYAQRGESELPRHERSDLFAAVRSYR